MAQTKSSARTRVERGIYRQANGKYAVCARRRGVLRFRTAGYDLAAARRAREELIAALEAGRVPASPHLRLDTVAAHWSKRFEAMVAAGERHPRTYEAQLRSDLFVHTRRGSVAIRFVRSQRDPGPARTATHGLSSAAMVAYEVHLST